MPDKLTDNEIVKALECCVNDECNCESCFLFKPKDDDCQCSRNLKLNTLDLINCLQGENERLFADNQKYLSVMLWGNKKNVKNLLNQIKTEAYKECIEKVKEEIAEALKSNYKAKAEREQKIPIYTENEFLSYCSGKIDCLRGLDNFLDNLLKEFEGDE